MHVQKRLGGVVVLALMEGTYCATTQRQHKEAGYLV